MFRKNTSGQFIHFQGVDATTGGIKSGVSWTARRCIDGTFAAAGGTATEDGTTGWYKFAMSQADTNGNNIGFNFTGTGAVPQTVNIITDGSPPDVNLKNAAGTAVTLDTNNVLNVSAKYLAGTALTGRDIGASVLLSSGSGTGQLDFTSGVVKANATQWVGGTIPAVNVTGVPLVDAKYLLGTIFSTPATAGIMDINLKNIANAAVNTSSAQLGVNAVNWGGGAIPAPNVTGVPIIDLKYILGTVLTETAGQIAAAFKKFFNIATPASTMDSLTLVGTATNLTNAPTNGDFTATMKTSLNAATPSVTVSDKTGFSLTSAYDPAKTASQAGDAMTLTSAYNFAKGTTAMTESYAAQGAAMTPVQALYQINQHLGESGISSTTKTVKKRDGSTTAKTFTLDSATTPTSITEAT